ncbi:hypothetical protein HDU76_009459, partial [Blyttiomyces sp. JEL0837]
TTDTEADIIKTQTNIVITSFKPWDITQGRPHDRSGTLNPADIEKDPSIIGIFKFRRQTPLTVSLRESALLNSLQSVCIQVDAKSGKGNNRSHHVILGVFTSNYTEACTLNFDFAFFQRQSGGGRSSFTRVPIIISNLVESTQEGTTHFTSSMPSTATFPYNPLANVISSMSTRYIEENERVVSICMKQLQDCVKALESSEEELHNLRKKLQASQGRTRAVSPRPASPRTPRSPIKGPITGVLIELD